MGVVPQAVERPLLIDALVRVRAEKVALGLLETTGTSATKGTYKKTTNLVQ